MNDSISRQAAIKAIDEYMDKCIELHYLPTGEGIKTLIFALPSAEVTLCHLDGPCEYQNADIAMPSEQPEQKSDIEEAVEYIKNAQEYLRDIGESWCANYLSDAIELLAGEKRGEER